MPILQEPRRSRQNPLPGLRRETQQATTMTLSRTARLKLKRNAPYPTTRHLPVAGSTQYACSRRHASITAFAEAGKPDAKTQGGVQVDAPTCQHVMPLPLSCDGGNALNVNHSDDGGPFPV